MAAKKTVQMKIVFCIVLKLNAEDFKWLNTCQYVVIFCNTEYWNPLEEALVICLGAQKKFHLPADHTGWHLASLEQLRNLRTFQKEQTLQGEKEVVFSRILTLSSLVSAWIHLVGRQVISLDLQYPPALSEHTQTNPRITLSYKREEMHPKNWKLQKSANHRWKTEVRREILGKKSQAPR